MIKLVLPYIMLFIVLAVGIIFLRSMFRGLDRAMFRSRRTPFADEKAIETDLKKMHEKRKKLKDEITGYSKKKPDITANLLKRWLKDDNGE